MLTIEYLSNNCKKYKHRCAGDVFTVSLLKRLSNDMWFFKVKGVVLEIEQRKKIDANDITTLFSKAKIAVPKNGIKGNIDLFLRDYSKTMNSSIYELILI